MNNWRTLYVDCLWYCISVNFLIGLWLCGRLLHSQEHGLNEIGPQVKDMLMFTVLVLQISCRFEILQSKKLGEILFIQGSPILRKLGNAIMVHHTTFSILDCFIGWNAVFFTLSEARNFLNLLHHSSNPWHFFYFQGASISIVLHLLS